MNYILEKIYFILIITDESIYIFMLWTEIFFVPLTIQSIINNLLDYIEYLICMKFLTLNEKTDKSGALTSTISRSKFLFLT